MWALIEDLVAGGTTLLLTTQYLEEADQLADNIVVIDQAGYRPGHRRRAQAASRRRADRGLPRRRRGPRGRDPGDLRGHHRYCAGQRQRRASSASPTAQRRGSLLHVLQGFDETVTVLRHQPAPPFLDDVSWLLTAVRQRRRNYSNSSGSTRPRRRSRDRPSTRPSPRHCPTDRIVTLRNIVEISSVPTSWCSSWWARIMLVLLFAYVFGGAMESSWRIGLQGLPLVPGIAAQ